MASEVNPRAHSGGGWVSGILLPSVASGITGGALIGCGCGYLLATPHLRVETTLGSCLIGAGVGFIVAWTGAATLGVVQYIVERLRGRG